MSANQPKTYMLHTFLLSLAILAAIILFLRSQWGGH